LRFFGLLEEEAQEQVSLFVALGCFGVGFLAAIIGSREAWHPGLFKLAVKLVYSQLPGGQCGEVEPDPYHGLQCGCPDSRFVLIIVNSDRMGYSVEAMD
jgi:hypothetical protein